MAAEETFLKWQASERLARALNSKSKPCPTYSPGELVFYWRHLGRKEAGQRFQTGHFYGYAGPARILALETRFDEDNRMRPSSVVWLVRNNRLMKASVEQLRKASNRERTMAEIDQEIQLPWTISDIVSPLGKNEYDDITMEVEHLPSREDRDEQPRFAEPPQKRHRTKAPVNAQIQEGANSSSSTARPEEPQPMAVEEDEEDPELFQQEDSQLSFWSREDAAVKYPYHFLQQGMGGRACPKTHKRT